MPFLRLKSQSSLFLYYDNGRNYSTELKIRL